MFTYSDKNRVDLGVPRYVAMVGQRRIYFLRRAGGRYRSVGDVTRYNLPVQSGHHEKAFCKGKSPGCCAAELLLTPGHDVDVASFAAHLYDEAEYPASVLCSQSAATALVRRLLQNPDGGIREAAQGLFEMLPRDATH